jgi:hypothetical protein
MVHQGVGRGWHCVASTLPCRCWCRAGLGSVQVHGNVQRALRALGCMAASIWRGHGDMYGRDRGHLIQGIGQGGLREVSGEAMGRETVGGLQLRSGALGGDGVAQGRRGVDVLGLCKAGSGRCVSRAASRDWGSRAAGWSTTRGQRGDPGRV